MNYFIASLHLGARFAQHENLLPPGMLERIHNPATFCVEFCSGSIEQHFGGCQLQQLQHSSA
jgi:hypothetical protein